MRRPCGSQARTAEFDRVDGVADLGVAVVVGVLRQGAVLELDRRKRSQP